MVAERFCFLPRPVDDDNFVIVVAGLTPAERRVLAYVRGGYSNKEIAALLARSEPTIKHQVSACMKKVGLSSRMRLMAALS